MLDPNTFANLATDAIVQQYHASYRERMQASISYGVGRGAELAHGIGLIGTMAAGLIFEKPSLFLLSGICMAGTAIGHRIHKQNEEAILHADMDTNNLVTELESRGYDLRTLM